LRREGLDSASPGPDEVATRHIEADQLAGGGNAEECGMEKELEPQIREQEVRLKSRHPHVTQCRVSVDDRPPHRYECRRFNVRLDIAFAGRAIVINREHDEDPDVALREAFDAAARQLEALEARRITG
jgi:hypothetical protein